MPQRSSTIRAAGGVVWRISEGRLEIALVHRPRYDDWSLPKGKLDDGETELAAAVREVREEIGSEVAVSRRVAKVAYDVGDDRKTVSYWLMRHVRGEFVATDEVDELAWMVPKQARTRISYEDDATVLREFSAVPIPDSVVVLVRHAKAGKRSAWNGADDKRPLDATGVVQADRLRAFLAPFAAGQVLSAEPVRCVETVRPFADDLGVQVVVEPAFSDRMWESSPAATEAAFYALAKPGRVTVVCSQGGAIPGLLERVVGGLRPFDTRKGAAWVLSLVDGVVVSADHYDDAAR